MTKVSLHRFAELPRRFLVALGLGIGLLTVGAIAPPPSPTQDAVAPPPGSLQKSYQILPRAIDMPNSFWRAVEANLPEVLTVTMYTPTETCEGFQAEERAIAADKAVPQLVHHLLADQTPHLLDFELAGYRVETDHPKGDLVTIDFRRAPDAQRHFISLSMCEQLVLFGSLRKTLLENPDLNIREVRFTERGRPIQL